MEPVSDGRELMTEEIDRQLGLLLDQCGLGWPSASKAEVNLEVVGE